ncbi:metallophosphoesterase family protein [Shimia sp. MMG029]|uniref:metallophosphoesterase family protein n=1 Tax=Shimia sp. MMG029 TaxID=3021978 RepID=UPI0022FDDFDD|nr:metallophosphoesterase family protein [Shimia sp. MMG029]MDA5555444.1 metallophosphoesterase family protein [Shimia sp. MMG029]
MQDLGRLEGRVLVFGGPYSNLQATQAVLQEARAQGIAGRNLICTGDVVAYCGQPAETVAAVRESGAIVVAGNCEIQLASGAADCGCGFEEGTTCDLLSAGWYGYAAQQVDEAARAWMAGLPDIVCFELAGQRVAVIHGGVTDVARFLWETSPESAFTEEIAALTDKVGAVDVVLAGHCGIPFERQIDTVRWINAGVIGMPPHDGGQATRYAVFDGKTVTFHTLRYDTAQAFRKMQKAGLTQGYHDGLVSGYWPSEDVLPEDLRVPLSVRLSSSRASG